MSARGMVSGIGALPAAALVIGTLALAASPAGARDSGQERETLERLGRMRAVVYLEGATNGLAAPALQNEVEQALRGVGLQIISAAQLQSVADAGLLIVSVASVENKLSTSDQLAGYAYRTDLSLW